LVTDGTLTWPVLDATEPLELSAGYVAETVSVGYIGDAVEYTPDEWTTDEWTPDG